MATFRSAEELLSYLVEHPEERDQILANNQQAQRLWNAYQAYLKVQETGDYRQYQGDVAFIPGVQFSPEQEKFIDNMIANQSTEEARQYDEYMRDTSYLSAGSQLQSLGLSNSGVLQTGGAVSQGVATADNVKSNLAQQNAINRYNQKMGLAKQLLSMTSQMASAGIYGSAIGAAKHAASTITSATAHSAYKALSSVGKFKQSDLPPLPSNNVGGFYSIFEQ